MRGGGDGTEQPVSRDLTEEGFQEVVHSKQSLELQDGDNPSAFCLQYTFSVKSQRVNTLGFAGHTVPMATSQSAFVAQRPSQPSSE